MSVINKIKKKTNGDERIQCVEYLPIKKIKETNEMQANKTRMYCTIYDSCERCIPTHIQPTTYTYTFTHNHKRTHKQTMSEKKM